MDRVPGGQRDTMWLSILIVVGIIGGLAAALAGIGPVAILLVLLALIALGVKVAGGRAARVDASPGTPQDDETLDKAHVQTGFAHTGQAHMTPDQERATT